MLVSVRTHFALGVLMIATLISLPFLYQRAQQTSAAAGDTFRVTEYVISSGTFSGTTHNLTLNQNLESDYFVIVQGSDGNGTSGSDRGPDENYVSLTSDPFGTGDLSTSAGSNILGFTRQNAVDSWVGVITVAECVSSCSVSGFQLHSVERVAHSGTDTSGMNTSGTNWSDIDQVMLMGGFNGSGCDTAQASSANHKVCHVRFFPSGNNVINWTRSSVGATLSASTSTVMVLEWGSEWTVQRVNVTGNAGGNGANAVNEYNTGTISAINRNNTWVWGTGHTDDQGIGDGAEGTLITLGNGVSQAATETTVAVGQEYSDNRSFEVYALTHTDLAVDYRFKADGNSGDLAFDIPFDTASDPINRMALGYNGCNGTGNAYPRPIFSARYTSDSNIRVERRRSGQNFPIWVQGIDFAAITPSVDLSTSTKIEDDADNMVTPNQLITYTISLINSGTVNATGVDIDDTISTNLQNLSTPNMSSCGMSFTDNSTATAIDVDDLDIAAGATCTVSFTANVKSGLAGGSTISNSAQVSAANEGGSAFTVNSSTLSVVSNTDLSVVLVSDDTEYSTGDTVTLTATVTNNGPASADSIEVFEILPSSLSLDSAVPLQGTYNSTSGLWDIGTLATSGSTTLTITATIDDDIGMESTSTASLLLSEPPDFNTANNNGVVTFEITDGGTSEGGGRRALERLRDEDCECAEDDEAETEDLIFEASPETSGETGDTDELSETAESETEPETNITGCPNIQHPVVCENLFSLFGDRLGNARQIDDSALHGSAPITSSCLVLDPERALSFADLTPEDPNTPFIEFLKNTRIKATGEYIVSGLGNHSAGDEGGSLSIGSWDYDPDGYMSRAAAVKTLLIANCIPIAKEIPVPEDGFRFRDIDVDTPREDLEAHYLARIFYTGYIHGVVKGYPNGTAKPNKAVTAAELISLLLRSIGQEPSAPEGGPWYKNNYTFAQENGLLNKLALKPSTKILRKQFAPLLLRALSYHESASIYSYMERSHIKHQTYDVNLPIHLPQPIVPES